MGFRFKLYDDRQFCNGHRTVSMGKPVGYLVDGCLSRETNLRILMEARAQVGGNFPAGVACDEREPNREIYQMQGMMREDHRFYKDHGFYDFPQKHPGRILGMYLVGEMMTNPKLAQKLGSRMSEGMLMPYRKVLKQAEKAQRGRER